MKKPRGRPVKYTLPEPVPDTLENVARAIMQGPPKRDWNFLQSQTPKTGADQTPEPRD